MWSSERIKSQKILRHTEKSAPNGGKNDLRKTGEKTPTSHGIRKLIKDLLKRLDNLFSNDKSLSELCNLRNGSLR